MSTRGRILLILAAAIAQVTFASAFSPNANGCVLPKKGRSFVGSLRASGTYREPTVYRRDVVWGLALTILTGITMQPMCVYSEDNLADDEESVLAATSAVPQVSVGATALFSSGDARFLQAVFETKRSNGVMDTSIGRLGDGTRAVKVTYDPSKCSYKTLLGIFWRNVDPTDGGGQFKDRGAEFRPVIYVSNDQERALAQESMKILIASGIYGEGAPRSIVPFAVEIKDRGTPETEFAAKTSDGDKELVGPGGSDEQIFKDAMSKSGRQKFFYDKYKPIKTTACQDGVCGFVYFPCTPENRCLDVTNGRW
jgi:hypothetical protein